MLRRHWHKGYFISVKLLNIPVSVTWTPNFIYALLYIFNNCSTTVPLCEYIIWQGDVPNCFNFFRYKDGEDYIGEHKDDEKDLVKTSPIASLSLGQTRDFVLKHADSRGRYAKRKMEKIKIELTHGSLLMMNYPTNIYWYHSIPIRKKATGIRINLTFRDFVTK